MSHNYTESELERAALEWFEEIGYEVLSEAEVSPESDSPIRDSYSEVVLMDRLLNALEQNNPSLPAEAIEEAYRQLTVPQCSNWLENNHAFHRMMTEGIDVEVRQPDGSFKTEKAWVFNKENPEANDFLVINQFTVKQGKTTKRLRWVSEKWTSRNNLGENYVLGGIHYETSTSTVHCRVQKERCQSCC